uniref:Uncharacterized protein n=1 Tax=Salix viminalis TaxID=40686 RepID=A0A6N2LCY1_SALVM
MCGVVEVIDAGHRDLEVEYSPEPALFPHVSLKIFVVHLQYSVEDVLVPEQVYKPWASVLDDGNEIMGPSFSDISDCEVVMVAGLPASGKTTRTRNWADEYPEKLLVLLGRNLILDEMRIAVVAFPKPEDLEFRADKRFKEMGWSKDMSVPDELSDQHSVADSLDHFIRKFLLNSNEGSRGEFVEKWILAKFSSTSSIIVLWLPKHQPTIIELWLPKYLIRFTFLGLPCGTPCFPLPPSPAPCSSILEDITLLLRETANFRIVSPSIPRDFGDLTSKLKTGKSRRRKMAKPEKSEKYQSAGRKRFRSHMFYTPDHVMSLSKAADSLSSIHASNPTINPSYSLYITISTTERNLLAMFFCCYIELTA